MGFNSAFKLLNFSELLLLLIWWCQKFYSSESSQAAVSRPSLQGYAGKKLKTLQVKKAFNRDGLFTARYELNLHAV